MAFPAVCILTMRNSSFVLLLLSLCSHGTSFTVLRPRVTSQWQAAVKSVKNMLKRTSHDKSDQYLALLEMRNTLRQDVNRSPAQTVFGRFARSVLPVFLKHCTTLDVRKRLTRRHQTKQCYDRHPRSLRICTLHANQPVYFQHSPRKGWTKGTIVHRIGPRSCIVKSIDGSTYKRNLVHIYPFTSRESSHSELQHCNTSMPVPFVSHPDVTCDSNAVPVNTQSRPVFSNPGDSSRSNDFDFSAIDDHPSGCAIILA